MVLMDYMDNMDGAVQYLLRRSGSGWWLSLVSLADAEEPPPAFCTRAGTGLPVEVNRHFQTRGRQYLKPMLANIGFPASIPARSGIAPTAKYLGDFDRFTSPYKLPRKAWLPHCHA